MIEWKFEAKQMTQKGIVFVNLGAYKQRIRSLF